jgi:hypothetical protein
MGIIPSTGSEVSMGKISRSLGISPSYPPSGGANISLNGTLGGQRSLATTTISNIGASTVTKESADFGGLTTPQDYPT